MLHASTVYVNSSRSLILIYPEFLRGDVALDVAAAADFFVNGSCDAIFGATIRMDFSPSRR